MSDNQNLYTFIAPKREGEEKNTSHSFSPHIHVNFMPFRIKEIIRTLAPLASSNYILASVTDDPHSTEEGGTYNTEGQPGFFVTSA